MAPALVVAFLGGLGLGSFVTVVGYRVPRGESVVGGRSHCPGCGTQIAAYDNVPVLSWVLLRGRGRCCGEPISARYPLTELALGLLFVATVAVFWDDPAEIALGLVFVTTLVAITLTDLEQRLIPNKILLVALAYPRGMGLGDVKLAAVMGLFLGRNVAPAILVALLSGSAVGLFLIARHGAEARKRAIPFGPFLAIGGVVGLLAGDQLVELYLSTFS